MCECYSSEPEYCLNHKEIKSYKSGNLESLISYDLKNSNSMNSYSLNKGDY